MTKATIFVDIVHGPIDFPGIRGELDDPDVGAHCWFYGVTRRTTIKADQGTAITETLAYEAHESMALAELRTLAEKAAEKFDLAHVVIVHRLGEVAIGKASVVVGCSSAHRVNTLSAIPWIMDLLKQDVPIWKRESYVDGTSEWVHPTGGDSQ